MTGRIARHIPALAILCLLAAHGAAAQNVEITSVVEPTSASVDDYISVRITVSGPDASKAGAPVLDTNDDFVVAGRPSTSQSFIMNNFKTSVTKSWTFRLRPKKVGVFEAGGASIKVGGKTFRAAPTKVEIAAGGARNRRSQRPSQRGNTPVPDTQSSDGDDGVFIKTFVDREDPYVGEQITLTFELYYRLSILTDPQYSQPTTMGFWSVALPQITQTTKIINNNIYRYNAIKTALFPTTSGELTIGEASLTYSFGGFFSPIRSRELKTKPIVITAKALPEKGRPANFEGAVGSFTLSSTADKKQLKVGDVVTVKVTVTGDGNLDLITSITPPDFSAFKTYDPKVSKTVSNSGFVVGGAKTWDYVLMPRRQGKITLEPFSLSYFDPSSKTYRSLETEPLDLTVIPGDASAFSSATRDISRSMVKNLATDIRFIKADKTRLESAGRRLHTKPAFYLLYIVPLLGFAAAFTAKKRSDAIQRNTALRRRLNAWKSVQKRLGEARAHLDKGNRKEFCGRLSEAVIGYIGDMMNLDTGTQTAEGIGEILESRGVPRELAERVRKNRGLCDFVQFSSAGSDHEIQENLLKETEDIISALKETFRG
ncbi:MAG: protein BatD [Candidatus Latescibacteria bacterium]|nr:protein BatD [Candidatus Latescibacterota bacterium]